LPRIREARSVLWRELRGLNFHAVVVEGGRFSHVGTTREYIETLTTPSLFARHYNLRNRAACAQVKSPIRDQVCTAVHASPAHDGVASDDSKQHKAVSD